MARAVICKGDPTSHGGKVLEGNEDATIDGRPIALRGHRTYCPLCKGEFPISEGLDHHSFAGIGTALEGMKTACGAILIVTQHSMTVDDPSTTGNGIASPAVDDGLHRHEAGIPQTNSSEDLRHLGYKNLFTGARLLVQAVDTGTATATASGSGNRPAANDPVATRIETDRATIRRIFGGETAPNAEEYSTGAHLLRTYGYRTGALETELAGRRLTIDQQAALLQGSVASAAEFAHTSAVEFANAPMDELRERLAVFSQQEGGRISRAVNGVTRTINFEFDTAAATLANGIGVGFEEARAKTNWSVYSGVIDAAFATQGVNSIRLNGLWRPSYETFTAYFANSRADQFSGMSAAQRTTASNRVMTRAGITPGTRWHLQHTRGSAIDIDRLNGAEIRNGATAENRRILIREPATIGNFTENLWQQDARSLLTPWRIYPGRPPAGFSANTAAAGDHYNHRNHIHYGQ